MGVALYRVKIKEPPVCLTLYGIQKDISLDAKNYVHVSFFEIKM